MTLVRSLRKWDLVALVINSVVGAGIFGLPSQVFALAGTYSLAAYATAALAIGLIVICFAEVSSRFGATISFTFTGSHHRSAHIPHHRPHRERGVDQP